MSPADGQSLPTISAKTLCTSSTEMKTTHTVSDYTRTGGHTSPGSGRAVLTDSVYYLPLPMLHLATSIARPNLVAMGTCFGKFSKSGKFKLGVTCLDWIATYAKYKVSWGCILGVKGHKPKGGEHSGWEGERNISLAGWLGRYLPLYSGLGARKDCDCHQQSRSIKSGHQG